MAINESDLRKSCFDIARITSWKNRDPQSISLDNIAKKAERYSKIAIDHVEYLESAGIDPNILIGAVSYLSVHAIPPMEDNDSWFQDMLEVLIQLFAPNFELGAEEKTFLTALRDAIDRNVANVN